MYCINWVFLFDIIVMRIDDLELFIACANPFKNDRITVQNII